MKNWSPIGNERKSMSIKILHFADVHLDISFAGMKFPVEVARRYRSALRQSLHRLVDLALREKVDFVTVGGDLYEQERYTPETGHFLAEEFARLAPVRVFLAPGNHDPLVPDSLYRQVKWPENVFIFQESELTPVLLTDGVVLWGLAHPEPSFRKKPLRKFQVPDDKTHILLLHGSDMSNVPGGKATHAPFYPEEIQQAGFAFALLGHYHQGRLSPEGAPFLAYPGSPEPLALCSAGLHGAIILEIEGKKVSARAVPTATYRSVRKEVDISELTHREAIVRKIAEALDGEAGEKVLAQVTLVGTRHPDVQWDVAALREALPKNFLHIYLEDQTLPGFALQDLREEKTVRGEFVRQMLAKMEEASGEQRELLRSALTFGLFAFEKKDVVKG